jgi:hypothetical protein
VVSAEVYEGDAEDCEVSQNGVECAPEDCPPFSQAQCDWGGECSDTGTHDVQCTVSACQGETCATSLEDHSYPCTRESRDGKKCGFQNRGTCSSGVCEYDFDE